MKTKIMLMIVVAIKSQNQNCVSGWRKKYLSVYDNDDPGDPDNNGDGDVHHDGSNLIF